MAIPRAAKRAPLFGGWPGGPWLALWGRASFYSGPAKDPLRHARLRRETVNLWALEMAGRGGRWQPTPFRDTKDQLVLALVEQFGWVLTPQDDTPWEPGTN